MATDLDVSGYDVVFVGMSGGKDSAAAALKIRLISLRVAELGAIVNKPRYGRLDKEKPRGTQRVYTYICSDGVARTRCYQHAMAAKGGRYGIPAFVSEYDVPKHMGKAHSGLCTECTWNQAAGAVANLPERTTDE